MPESEGGYNLGVLKGGLELEFPEAEKEKMDDVSDDAGAMQQMFEKFNKGAGAKLGALAAGAGIVMASQGFSSFFKTLKDVVGFLSDLLFVALLPVIRPLFDLMSDIANIMQDALDEPGALFSSLLDPTFISRLALAFLEAIIEVSGGLLKIGTKILEGFIQLLQSDNTLEGEFAKLRDEWGEVKAEFKEMWTWGSKFSKTLLTFFTTLWSKLDDTGAIRAVFSFAWELLGVAVDVLKLALGALIDVLLDPDTWKAIGNILVMGMAAFSTAFVVIGRNIAEGIFDELKALSPVGEHDHQHSVSPSDAPYYEGGNNVPSTTYNWRDPPSYTP